MECRILPYSLKFAKVQSRAAGAGTSSEDGIFVKGFLRSQWMHSDLHRAFEGCGKILSAKVSLDRQHKCKGFGYIQFETAQQAQKAISEVSENLITNP